MSRGGRNTLPHNPQLDAKGSSADVVLLWLIESLAGCKESDTGVLRTMISMVSDFSGRATESTKKMVALRYLQELLGSDGGDAPATSSSSHGAGVDRTSKEAACSDLQKSKGGCESESTMKLIFSSNDGDHPQLQHSVSLAPDCGDLILQEEEPYGPEKYLPEQDVSDGKKRNHLHKNNAITGGLNVHLIEQGSMCQQCVGGIAHLNDGEARSPNLGAAPDLDNNNISLKNQPLPVQDVSHCDRRNHLEKDITNTGGNNVQLPRQSSLPQDPCKEKASVQNAGLNGSERNLKRPHQENDLSDGVPVIVPETSSDSGSDCMPSGVDPDDEMFSAEKQRLFDSQIDSNHDSISGDWTEQSFCIKCAKGGQLLSCSSNGCSVSVHERCLAPLVSLEGIFYCPFCSYTRAAIAQCEAKKKVIQAKKALSAFIGLAQDHRKKLVTAKAVGETSKVGDVGNESLHSHQYQRDKSGEHSLNAKEKCQQTQAANTCNNDNFPSGLVEVPKNNHVEMINDHNGSAQVHQNQLSDSANVISSRKLPCDKVTPPTCSNTAALINGDGGVGNDCGTVGSVAKGKAKITSISDHVHLPNPTPHGQRKSPRQYIDHDTSNQKPGDGHTKRLRVDTAGRKIHHQENVENLNRRESTSRSRSKHVSQPKLYSTPEVALCRRQRHFWTPIEEETLKNAVERFASERDGNLSWVKILESGEDVFHKTRKPEHLKEKWKKLKKKELQGM